MYLGPYQRPAQPCQLHSATAQQSPQGSSMKGLCAVVGIGTTAVLPSVLNSYLNPTLPEILYLESVEFKHNPGTLLRIQGIYLGIIQKHV